MKPKKDIEKLRWIRVFTPDHIPKHLVEQVRDRDYTVEDFYKYHHGTCLIWVEGGEKRNPLSHLYVLVDDDNLVQGFLWFSIVPLTQDLVIQTYSVEKDYWGAGAAVNKLAEHIKAIRREGKLNKIYWINKWPKHSEKYGFKKSKAVLMEYDPKIEEKGENG